MSNVDKIEYHINAITNLIKQEKTKEELAYTQTRKLNKGDIFAVKTGETGYKMLCLCDLKMVNTVAEKLQQKYIDALAEDLPNELKSLLKNIMGGKF